MVVQMKKLQVLLPAADRETFLTGLAKVGVVHIEEAAGECHSSDLEQIGASIKRYRSVFDRLEKLSKEGANGGGTAATAYETAESIVKEFETLEVQRESAMQSSIGLQKDVATLTPWGDFDPHLIEKLKNAAVSIRFFETGAKKFGQLALTEVPHAIITTGNTVKFIVIDRDEPSAIDADEISLPATSLSALKAEIAALEQQIDSINKKISALVPHRARIMDAITAFIHDESFESARCSLEQGAQGAVLLLSGWLPTNREKSVKDFLALQTAWFEIRDPRMNDQPPVKMKNSAYVSKFEPITKMFALPNYFELDPTPFFAPFFMFFYGMCLGDVGYGAIILIAALVLIAKGPVKLKNIFILGSFLGATTILNGFFLNSFFGATIFDVTGVEGIAGAGGGIPFLSSVIVNGKTEFPAITFAIYIGIFQMMLGMLLNVVNKLRQQGFIYAVQPMCYLPLTMAFFILLCKVNFLNMGVYAVNDIHIGSVFAGTSNAILFTLLGIGIVPFIFLNSPQIRPWIRPLRFFWEMYNFVNGIVGNGLSYLRLFALGLAGGLLGKAFNDIALMLITNDQGQVTFTHPLIVGTVLIMVAGHALNFALSALGAYVHSVRLIFVEFYNNLSFQGGGKPYVPFTENVTNN
jgi:V/A-type H+-transporting ATPase subunit I